MFGLTSILGRTSYWRRLINHFAFPRIRRAAIACMIVMLSQQLSGINIIAFLATTFFTTAGLRPSSEAQAQIDSYKLAIGWGAANAIFSMWAYFLVENKEEPSTQTEVSSHFEDDRDDAISERNPSESSPSDGQGTLPELTEDDEITTLPDNSKIFEHNIGQSTFEKTVKENRHTFQALSKDSTNDVALDPKRNSHVLSARSSIYSADPPLSTDNCDHDLYEYDTRDSHQLRGRRFLLLLSLFGGAVTLLITSLCFNIHEGSPARLPLIAFFIIIFTLFYSIGAGMCPKSYPSSPPALHLLIDMADAGFFRRCNSIPLLRRSLPKRR